MSFLTSQQTSLVFRERERELFLDSFSNKSAVSFSVSSLPQTQSQPSIFLSLSLSHHLWFVLVLNSVPVISFYTAPSSISVLRPIFVGRWVSLPSFSFNKKKKKKTKIMIWVLHGFSFEVLGFWVLFVVVILCLLAEKLMENVMCFGFGWWVFDAYLLFFSGLVKMEEYDVFLQV